MVMTREEAREWFQIRDNVREAVQHLELCSRCWRIRDTNRLVRVRGGYYCRPDDRDGCMGPPQIQSSK